jgi:ABC-type protease/lipase transport system fused ATPase/permease subunit
MVGIASVLWLATLLFCAWQRLCFVLGNASVLWLAMLLFYDWQCFCFVLDIASLLSTTNLRTLYALKVILYFLLMVFLTLLETHRRFILKLVFEVRDADVRDGVFSPLKYIWKPKHSSFTCTICRVS